MYLLGLLAILPFNEDISWPSVNHSNYAMKNEVPCHQAECLLNWIDGGRHSCSDIISNCSEFNISRTQLLIDGVSNNRVSPSIIQAYYGRAQLLHCNEMCRLGNFANMVHLNIRVQIEFTHLFVSESVALNVTSGWSLDFSRWWGYYIYVTVNSVGFALPATIILN